MTLKPIYSYIRDIYVRLPPHPQTTLKHIKLEFHSLEGFVILGPCAICIDKLNQL